MMKNSDKQQSMYKEKLTTIESALTINNQREQQEYVKVTNFTNIRG